MTDKVKYHRDKADYWRMCLKTATPGSELAGLCIRMIAKHEQAAKEARRAGEICETLRRDHSGD